MKNQHDFGNRITANADGADDAKQLIKKALEYVEEKHGYSPIDESTLFQGVYYDSQKVGSYILKVRNSESEVVVLKLQLRPLPFDEGFIIRSVEKNIQTDMIRPVRVLHDIAWNEDLGFGYLLFEDISHLPNIWAGVPTQNSDRELHKRFLDIFYRSVLPIKNAWIPEPKAELKEKILEAFEHFYGIAKKSSHHHIDQRELQSFIDEYLSVIRLEENKMEMHFTHGHMSGFDVKYDSDNNQFILMANLYWSWRPKYYEMVFPIWVDLMHIRDADLTFKDFLERVTRWVEIWPQEVTSQRIFWLMLLERAMITIMLDLGASEWQKDETREKQALLNSWKEFFAWLIQTKL